MDIVRIQCIFTTRYSIKTKEILLFQWLKICYKPFTHIFRSKNQVLDDEIIRLKRTVTEWEKRYRDKEQEFFLYKEKQRSAPEVKLQAEINTLTLEKVHYSFSLIRIYVDLFLFLNLE